MIKNLALLLSLIFTANAIASYQPLSIKGQQDASAVEIHNWQTPNTLSTIVAPKTYLNETGNNNILANPSFEHSTFNTSWSATTVTPAVESTVVIDGKKSLSMVASSQAWTLTQSSTLYQAQFADGVQGAATVRIKTTHTGAISVCSILAGAVSTSNCVTAVADGKWATYKVPFVLGGTSNGISISAASGTGTTYVDNAFVGVSDLKQDQSIVGPWIAYTPTFSAGFGTVTSINFAYRQVGSEIEIRGSATTGTVAASAASFTIPSGMTLDTASPSVSTLGTIVGHATNTSSAVSGVPNSSSLILLSGATTGITWSNVSTGSTVNLSANNVSTVYANTTSFSVKSVVPIVGLRGSTSTYSAQSANTGWVSCGHTTSDFTGFGTVTNIETECKRDGDDLLMQGKFTAGTTTATEARLNLKLNGTTLTSAGTSKIPSIQESGTIVIATTGAAGYYTLKEPSVGYITFSVQSSGTQSLTKATGSGFIGTGTTLSFLSRVPINTWETSGAIVGSFLGMASTPGVSLPVIYSFDVSAAGVVSNESGDPVNGNCSLVTSVFTCTWNSGKFSALYGCAITITDAAAGIIRGVTKSTSALVFDTRSSVDVATAKSTSVICHGGQ